MAVAERDRARSDERCELRLTLFDGERTKVLDDLDGMSRKLGRSSLLWIDAGVPSEDEARWIAEALELDDEAVAGLVSDGRTTRFRDGGHFVVVTLEAPEAEKVDSVVEVTCLVGKHWVVTSHARPIAVLDEFAELAEGSGRVGELDGPSFLAALVAWVLKSYDTAFDELEEELAVLDEDAMRGKGAAEVATFCVGPAIANAIDDAVGVRLTEMPLNPETVYRALRAKEGRPRVKIHPDDLARLGIADGALVRMGNERGEIRLHAESFSGLQRGVVIVESIPPNEQFPDGEGLNTLTSAFQPAPFGGAAFHDNHVWIKAA